MKTYELVTTKTVTQEQIDDVITTALEGGITYWCLEAGIEKAPTEEYEYMNEVLTRGGTLRLYAVDRKEVAILTLENLLKVFTDSNFDFDNYDAGDADNAIQTAVFGELIYG